MLAVRRGAIMAGSLVVVLAAAGPTWAAQPTSAQGGAQGSAQGSAQGVAQSPAQATAQTAAPDRATERRWRAACTHDAFDICTFLALSGNRAGVRACLERNIDRISPECRRIIRAGQARNAPTPQPAE
ncbi:MAG: hypothetical protein P4L73_15535 [Caulobacteraceae bacterium]|nr:hypothetical protein [Caulobacteraceae bacterium]